MRQGLLKTTAKILWVLSFIACNNAYAQSYANSSSRHAGGETRASLHDVLNEIKQRHDVSFLYTQENIGKIVVHGNLNYNKPVEHLLKKALTPHHLKFEKISDGYYSIYLPKMTSAIVDETANNARQQLEVRGTVTDTSGATLPGVSVSLKNTTGIGTSTNLNGKYILDIPENDNPVLVFTYIGFKTIEVPVRERQVIDVVMQSEESQLKEVIVVGYGTQKKISVTGAISTVPVKELQQVATPSLSNTIGGKLPGIITRQAHGEPGYDAAQVLIRGMGTWANRSPLILVDGVERDMNDINIQAIESFSILKDASATAVYGVRGANGVILITTKRGEVGKPEITFRSEGAMLTSLRIPEYINSGEYATLMNEALDNVEKPRRFTDEEIEKFRTGSDPYLYPNVDWNDVLFKETTHQTMSNLSISGGSQTVRYFTNVGFTVQNGIYKEDNLNEYKTNANLKRYNFRSNVDINLSKNFKIDLGLGGIIRRANYPGSSMPNIFDAIKRTPPLTFPVKNPDGTPGGILAFLGSNPWGMVTQSGYAVQNRNTLQGTFGANWNLSSLVTEGLSLNGKFAYDHYYFGTNTRHKTFAVRQYLGKDPETGEDLYQTHREELPLGYSIGNDANRALYTEASVNYNRTFIDKHTFTGLLLFNRRDYVNLTAGSSTDNLAFRRQGIAGRLTYDFDNRYLAEFNFGYNGSENFPQGKQYGFFPSLSAGWIVSNEKFWKAGVVSQLKIRGSYGQVGNDQIGGRRFLFLTTVNRTGQSYRFGDGHIFWQGFEEGFIGNPNVSWEVSTKANIGIDLELFNGKVRLQADAFNEEREGILMQRRDVPTISGFYPWSIPYANLGIVKNKGLDGLLEVRNTTPGGFFYSFRGNFTFARNEIIENDEPKRRYDYLSEKGHPIDQPFGYVAMGFFEDEEDIENSPVQTFMTEVRPGDIKFRDLNDDGVIDTYDRMPIGQPRTPEIMYGFGGTIGYKGFDLSIHFAGVANTSLFLDFGSMFPFADGLGSWNVLREYYDHRWTPDNPDPKYPAVIDGPSPNNYRTSTLYMKNGNYLRIKNAEVGYNLPEGSLKRLKVKGIRVFVNGVNLHTWDHVKVINPESNHGTGEYPLQRTLNLGAEVTF